MRLVSPTELGLQSRLTDLLTHWPIGGGTVAAVRRDGAHWIQPFGLANIDAQEPVDRSHLFEIGSISKIATSIVIGALVDQGIVALDDQATTHLPWLELPGFSREATIRHLLQHTAGIICGADGLADEKAQAWSLRNTHSASRPGEFFHYSNVGFQILGLIASRLAGTSLAEATTSRFLTPAGMHSTRAEIRNLDRLGYAIGYAPLRDDLTWSPSRPLAPATWLETTAGDGHIASTIEDMLRFVRVLLGNGNLDGNLVISESYFDQMVTSLAPEGEDILQVGRLVPVSSSRYGLGVNVEQTRYGTQFSHGGGMVGYASFLLADPANDLGIVVLTNSNGDSPIAELIAREVHAELLGEPESERLELNPARWTAEPEMLGRFFASDTSISIESQEDGRICLRNDHGSGQIFRTLSEQFVCEHPDFRAHRLSFKRHDESLAWSYGGIEFQATEAEVVQANSDWKQFEGHYRSHSPWFSNFRVFQRSGKLYLDAVGGVEAPGAEQQLVQLGAKNFRIGGDPRLPERLEFGPVVDGRSIFAERDGHQYARLEAD